MSKKITYLKYRIALEHPTPPADMDAVQEEMKRTLDKLANTNSVISWKMHKSEEVRPISAGGDGWRPDSYKPPYRMVLSDAAVKHAFENEAPLIVQVPLKPSAAQRKWLTEEEIHKSDALYDAEYSMAVLTVSGRRITTISARCRVGMLVYGKEIWRPVVGTYSSWVEYKAGFGNMSVDVLENIGPKGKADMRYSGYPKSRHSPLWRPAACMPNWACRLRFDVWNVELVRMNDKWQWQITMKKVAPT